MGSSTSVFQRLQRLALAIGVSLSGSAFAAQVTYEFTTVDGHSGSFSYEDTLVSPTPSEKSAGYDLLSFTLDGTSLASPYLTFLNDSSFHLADLVSITSATPGIALRLYATGNLFANTDLAQLNGHTLVDFANPVINRTRLEIGFNSSPLASLQQVSSVPEPGGIALMLAALCSGGGWLARRRKGHAGA